MAKKNILFIITAIITISIFALGFNLASSSVLEAISFLNSYGGFFGFISIALLIFLFFIEKKYEGRKINAMKENQKRGYREKQKRILVALKRELEELYSDIKGHELNFVTREASLAFFPIKPLNRLYYVYELDDYGDVEIKGQISAVSDKVILLNSYIGYIMDDFNKDLLSRVDPSFDHRILEKNIQEKVDALASRPTYHYWKEHAKMVMEDAEPVIKGLLGKIERRLSTIS